MKAKCLMLDIDGVLVDGRPGDGQNWKTSLMEDLGVSPSELSQAFFKVEWQDIVEGRKELMPTLEAALTRMTSPVRAKDLISYWFEMDSRIVESVLLDVQVARKRGMPVFLTTNQEHMRAEYLMQTVGLGREVDGIVYSALAGHKKPDREFFAFAERTAGFAPDELLLVDDTPANVEGALASGWSAVHWNGSEELSAILQRSMS